MRFLWTCVFVLAGCGIAAGSYFAVDYYLKRERVERAANDPAILVCEAVAKARLKAPSSYKRVDAQIVENRVRISYDAVNSYNAPLRGSHICEFEADDEGRATFARSDDASGAMEEMKRLTADIERAREDGTFQKNRNDFDRRYKDALQASVDAMGFVILDHETAKATGRQPIPLDQTSVRPTPPAPPA